MPITSLLAMPRSFADRPFLTALLATSLLAIAPAISTRDGQGMGTCIAHIRSERDGGGNGRVYRVTYSSPGVGCTGFVTFVVPHDQGGHQPVDDGQIYDSTDGCK